MRQQIKNPVNMIYQNNAVVVRVSPCQAQSLFLMPADPDVEPSAPSPAAVRPAVLTMD